MNRRTLLGAAPALLAAPALAQPWRPDRPIEIVVAPSARPGNWLPANPEAGRLRLMLRLYETPLSLGGAVAAADGPWLFVTIAFLACAAAFFAWGRLLGRTRRDFDPETPAGHAGAAPLPAALPPGPGNVLQSPSPAGVGVIADTSRFLIGARLTAGEGPLRSGEFVVISRYTGVDHEAGSRFVVVQLLGRDG